MKAWITPMNMSNSFHATVKTMLAGKKAIGKLISRAIMIPPEKRLPNSRRASVTGLAISSMMCSGNMTTGLRKRCLT